MKEYISIFLNLRLSFSALAHTVILEAFGVIKSKNVMQLQRKYGYGISNMVMVSSLQHTYQQKILLKQTNFQNSIIIQLIA